MTSAAARCWSLASLVAIAGEARGIIAAAEADGVAIDDGNVVDLLADHLTRVPLDTLRDALVVAGLAARFPRATRRHLGGSMNEQQPEPGRFESWPVLDGRRRFEVRDVQTGEPVSWEVFADAAFGSGPGAVVVTGHALADRASVAVLRRALATIAGVAREALNRTTGTGDLEALEAIAAEAGSALDLAASPGDLAELLGQDDDELLDAILDDRARSFDGDLATLATDAGELEQAIAHRARMLAGGGISVGAAFNRIAEVLVAYRERVRLRLRKRLGGAAPPR